MNRTTTAARAAATLLLATLAACARPQSAVRVESGPPPRAGNVLAWSQTAPRTVSYQISDTSRITVQAGPVGNVDVVIALDGTTQLQLQPGTGDSVNVSAQFTDFRGSFRNSMGPSVTIAKEDVTGASTLTVGPRGEFNIVQRAQGSDRLKQVATVEALYRNLFVRLPNRAVTVGATWTDTVTATDAREGVSSSVSSVVNTTYAADTTIGTRRLAVLRSVAANTLEISGASQGTQLVQKMQGTSNITTLWDPQQRLVYIRTEVGDLKGTMDLPAMGMSGLPLTASTRRMYKLVE